MRINKFLLAIVTLLFSFVLLGNSVFAQEETLEAIVEKILEEKQIKPMGSEDFQLYQKLEFLVTKGSLKDKKITIENGNIPVANNQKYKIDDKVIVTFSKDFEGNDYFYITDYIRRDSLVWLFLIFIVLTAAIAKWRGITSILGMGISFLVIFAFILPKISAGSNPVQIAIIGSLIIIPVTFYFSHGFNKKTTVAVVGTVIALIITGVLANIFVEAARLTGFATEEAGFLQFAKQGAINIKGLLLAGIIIGVLGVLDDITVSQSAIVFQLKEANEKLKFNELYKRAMNVGQDHISSMVNTLVLVYRCSLTASSSFY
ncbi:MAG: YibE/F family protein [bacterium]